MLYIDPRVLSKAIGLNTPPVPQKATSGITKEDLSSKQHSVGTLNLHQIHVKPFRHEVNLSIPSNHVVIAQESTANPVNDTCLLDDTFLDIPFLNNHPSQLPDPSPKWDASLAHTDTYTDPWNSTFNYTMSVSNNGSIQSDSESHQYRSGYDLQQIRSLASPHPYHPQAYTSEIQTEINGHMHTSQSFDGSYTGNHVGQYDSLVLQVQDSDVDLQHNHLHRFDIPFRTGNQDYDQYSGSWVLLDSESGLDGLSTFQDSVSDEIQYLPDDRSSLTTPPLIYLDPMQYDSTIYPITINSTYQAQSMSLDIAHCGQAPDQQQKLNTKCLGTVAGPSPTENRRRKRRHTTTSLLRPPGTGLLRIAPSDRRRLSEPDSATSLIKMGRKGPLKQFQKREAGKHRKQKTICIRCKFMKISTKCDRPEDGDCSHCQTQMWEQPCVKAHFLDVVKSGTLNYISQRAINHFTVDGSRRVRLELSDHFNMDNLLQLLQSRQGQFNIRARQASGSLYVLDLGRCFHYLSTMKQQQQNTTSDSLRSFIDRDLLQRDDWLRCVTDCNPQENELALLSTWNNMPSRATYSLVHRDGSGPPLETPIDVLTPEGQATIMLAAQLSRIVCRKMEVAGYEALQRLINDWSSVCPETQLAHLYQFGHILLTLRWRVSWWELLGDGGGGRNHTAFQPSSHSDTNTSSNPNPDIHQERYESRVHLICRTLYFYYCHLRKKRPSFAVAATDTATTPTRHEGIYTRYADAGRFVFDDFPREDSIAGFEAWMDRGKGLIAEAGVARNLERIIVEGTVGG